MTFTIPAEVRPGRGRLPVPPVEAENRRIRSSQGTAWAMVRHLVQTIEALPEGRRGELQSILDTLEKFV